MRRCSPNRSWSTDRPKLVKIRQIRLYQHDLGVRDGRYDMSISHVESLDSTVVAIETDTGLVGYGETCPLGPAYQPQHAAGARAALGQVAPYVLGLDASCIGLVNDAMDAALLGHGYAKAAIDIACWDLVGRQRHERVCDLLGGARNDPVPSYYGILPTDPVDAAAQAVALQDQGFGRLQIKTGKDGVDVDIAVTRAVAEVTRPGVKLLADANRGWTQRDAILFSEACADIPLALEQPCNTMAENAALRGRVRHPVFLDESADSVAAVMEAIETGVAQGFGMKVSRVGGISKMATVIAMCSARSIPLTCDDTWGGDITAATTVHLGASVPSRLFEGTWIAEPYTASSYHCRTAPITNGQGHIDVPSGPGLGVEPNLELWPDPIAVFG